MWLQTQWEAPRKPWIFRRNFNSLWLLNKYNSKNMRISDIHKRKNNLLWGFISWRGFLSKRKKEKKRKLHLIIYTEQIYFLYPFTSTSIKETFSLFLQTIRVMLFIFILFILIFKIFLLCNIFLGWLLHSFKKKKIPRAYWLLSLAFVRLLSAWWEQWACRLSVFYTQPEDCSGKGCYFTTYDDRKMNHE